ncbi:MAG: MFS transporter [Rhizobiales bacterium]|nr:MFS transporter [Hyphomicrobiales bacterium]
MDETNAKRWAQAGMMATLALSMLLASLGTSIANIALPALAEAFAAPFVAVQAVVVAYLATLTVTVVVAGRLGDRFGMKPMLVTGLGVFALASLLCGAAPDLPLLIGARALQGIGAAFLMTLSMALVRQTAGEARLGQAMGLLGTVSALGTALGPSLGGLLIPAAGWRGIFWVQVPPALIALAMAVMLLPGRRTAATAGPAAFGFGAVLEPRLASALLVNLLVAMVMMTTLVVGPFYLALGLGLPQVEVGLVMAVGPVISIVSGIPSGRLVDSWGSGRVLALGLVLLAAGAFMLAGLSPNLGVAGYLLSIALLTPVEAVLTVEAARPSAS